MVITIDLTISASMIEVFCILLTFHIDIIEIRSMTILIATSAILFLCTHILFTPIDPIFDLHPLSLKKLNIQ
jgi:hypothetical protein